MRLDNSKLNIYLEKSDEYDVESKHVLDTPASSKSFAFLSIQL